LVDSAFGGLQEIASALVATKDRDLLLDFTPWLITKHPAQGVSVSFIRMISDVNSSWWLDVESTSIRKR
jgi:hypothetical protein